MLDPSTAASLIAWLENERRLGIDHIPVPSGALESLTGAPTAPHPRRANPERDAAPSTDSSPANARPDSPRPTTPPSPLTKAPDSPAPRAAASTRDIGPGTRTTANDRPPNRDSLPPLPHVAPLPPLVDRELSTAEASDALARLDAEFVRGCRKCRLCEGRTQTVFGVGHPRPELMFVGEGPGADEDAQGVPFVGRAGQLLTRMIAAMSLTREQVYIGNVVKCRPPGNRTPAEDEMAACSPYLLRQIAILRPKVIVTLGRPAAQTLLATKEAMGKLRGRFYAFPPPAMPEKSTPRPAMPGDSGPPPAMPGVSGPTPAESMRGLPSVQVMPTYHPAYLLRNPDAKREVWEDLQQVMAVLGLKPPPGT